MRSAIARTVSMLLFPLLSACTPPQAEEPAVIERGRYLVQISGCNDCHTEEFMERSGDVAENEWLKGSRRGWYNEQGTTYAANLRLLINRIDAEQWMSMARTMKTRAPMAWYRLREISDADLHAIYRYVRWLGPAGNPAPPALPPGTTPPEPYIFFPNVH